MPQTRDSGTRRDETSGDAENAQVTEDRRDARDGTGAWFAETTARTGLALIGLVLLLFALGQAIGVDLLGAVAEALTSQTGRWLVVAFFAVLLIVGAAKWGFGRRRR